MAKDDVRDFVRKATILARSRVRWIGNDEMDPSIGDRDRRPIIRIITCQPVTYILGQFRQIVRSQYRYAEQVR